MKNLKSSEVFLFSLSLSLSLFPSFPLSGNKYPRPFAGHHYTDCAYDARLANGNGIAVDVERAEGFDQRPLLLG